MNKEKMKKLTIVLVVTFLFVSTSIAVLPGKAETEELAFPDVTISSTAVVDVDVGTVVNKLDLSALPLTEHIKRIEKTKDGIRLTIDSEIGLTSTDADDVSISPAVEKTEDVDSWQLELFLDKGTNYFENTTDQEDAYAITNDFNSGTYQYLAVKRARTYSTSNTTIVVTYADSLSANISSTDDVTNTTIFNDFIATQKLLWFRLDLETSNSSRPYILHIAFDELVCDAIYIFSLPVAQDFRDERYLEIYMGTDETAVDTSSLSDSVEWQKIYKQQADYTENFKDNSVKGVGFETADDFEQKLYEAWVALINNEIGYAMQSYYGLSSIDVGDIRDYQITAMKTNTILNRDLSDTIYQTLRNERSQSSAIQTYLREARKNTIRRFTITTNVKPNVIKEDNDAEDITDTSNAVVAAAERSKGTATSFGTNILDKVTNALGKISEPLGIFIAKARTKANLAGISDNWLLIGAVGGSILITAVVVYLITKRKR